MLLHNFVLHLLKKLNRNIEIPIAVNSKSQLNQLTHILLLKDLQGPVNIVEGVHSSETTFFNLQMGNISELNLEHPLQMNALILVQMLWNQEYFFLDKNRTIKRVSEYNPAEPIKGIVHPNMKVHHLLTLMKSLSW